MAQAVHPVAGAPANVYVTGRRVLAIVADSVVLGVANFVIMFAFDAVAGADASGLSLQGLPALLYFVLVAAIAFGYFAYLEGTRGQTVGKMLVGIKVVREGTNEAPGLGAASIRTVLRLVDGLFVYLVGFIVVLVSEKKQRLGDMAAGTSVIRK